MVAGPADHGGGLRHDRSALEPLGTLQTTPRDEGYPPSGSPRSVQFSITRSHAAPGHAQSDRTAADVRLPARRLPGRRAVPRGPVPRAGAPAGLPGPWRPMLELFGAHRAADRPRQAPRWSRGACRQSTPGTAAANPARYRSMCAALRLLEVKDRSVELVAAARVADPDDMAVVGYHTARAAAAVRRADPLLQSFDALALSTDLGLPRPRTTDRCLSLSIPAAPCVPGCHWHTMPLGTR